MEDQAQKGKQTSWGIIAVIIVIVIAGLSWLYISSTEQEKIADVTITPVIKTEIAAEPIPEKESVEPEIAAVVEPEPFVETIPEIILPSLDESDVWVQEKLPNYTWRKELLKLVINKDMVRRFVVFTDNFAQGNLAYAHSPLVKPSTKFSANEINNGTTTDWKWNESTTQRFTLYVDLLRSFDSETLVQWYFEMKPLIDQAYAELGYPEDNFTDVLHDAITKVLDMEIPKESLDLVRPSVMFRYKDEQVEALDDADKLLLRLGKENLLVIKSVLLEINERLARQGS
ncbi:MULTISPECIES: DUF3014 domain-containing protein [unclassified Colwellia]|uniref:DUF3014 domain-containing protein n=1 Tax=unclassified Colwellia TaxID=196834 RepID=UPI0015F4B032|nr:MULTISPECIES: DUF3014 domain-containing protein [unclassified Colwellia]MBA6231560.1 DUF3014 domain-containing protein [Colwellia sp. MB02u-7]MBA6235424.1 DUF3014 domain-containing protein [Colwellia sp. MB02u-11]MBA6254619.1 DUF3014 domain-containing protein [Colwellia sp. MB3u-28]MBA6259937.1 DUF3014 domain-containing protein [Colwellia sp. MB3u-41]MBA6299876.1 DUF3014 domain-containing protein [Colwellia sp. MB3u-22]